MFMLTELYVVLQSSAFQLDGVFYRNQARGNGGVSLFSGKLEQVFEEIVRERRLRIGFAASLLKCCLAAGRCLPAQLRGTKSELGGSHRVDLENCRGYRGVSREIAIWQRS